MRICLVYDCLYPHTVGGAERWYRNLAERLAAAGHEVTYLTLRQWDRGQRPDIDSRVRVVVAGPRMRLYAGGRRRIPPPLVFGLGVLAHLLRHPRRYEVVHTASFPYFSLLAAALVRPISRFSLTVDWHEVWSRGYWREYLGVLGGRIGYAVQLACVRVPQRAFCFSRLHAGRLRQEGLRGQVTVLEGEYAGGLTAAEPLPAQPVVVFAGRMIPEKRAPLGVAGVSLACERIPGLRGIFFGDGPQREAVLAEIALHEAPRCEGVRPGTALEKADRLDVLHEAGPRREGVRPGTALEKADQRLDVLHEAGPRREAVLAARGADADTGPRQGGRRPSIEAPGFVSSERVDEALASALCMLLPSSREGYGMVVVEASARGTPSIVIAGEDNAAIELVEDGINGVIVQQPEPDAIADAIVRIHEAGMALRHSTAAWFQANAQRLSLESSLEIVLASYAAAGDKRHQDIS